MPGPGGRPTRNRPWDAAALTTGALLLVTAPAYPWYAMLLVALVGLGARVEWLAVAVAGYVAQYAGELGLAASTAQRAGYGLAGLIGLLGWWLRRSGWWRLRRSGWSRLRRERPGAASTAVHRPTGCSSAGGGSTSDATRMKAAAS